MEDFTFIENMIATDGKTRVSAYTFLNGEKNRIVFRDKNPDEFLQYGKSEMRVRIKS